VGVENCATACVSCEADVRLKRLDTVPTRSSCPRAEGLFNPPPPPPETGLDSSTGLWHLANSPAPLMLLPLPSVLLVRPCWTAWCWAAALFMLMLMLTREDAPMSGDTLLLPPTPAPAAWFAFGFIPTGIAARLIGATLLDKEKLARLTPLTDRDAARVGDKGVCNGEGALARRSRMREEDCSCCCAGLPRPLLLCPWPRPIVANDVPEGGLGSPPPVTPPAPPLPPPPTAPIEGEPDTCVEKLPLRNMLLLLPCDWGSKEGVPGVSTCCW